MQLRGIVSLLFVIAPALASFAVHSAMDTWELGAPSDRQSIGRTYSLTKDSFRIYLGSADECTQVIFCKNDYKAPTPSASATTATPTAPAPPPAPKYDATMCSETDRIVFNLLDNTVSHGTTKKQLLSATADFILNKDGTFELSVFDALTTSDAKGDTKDAAPMKFDLSTWDKVTLIGSGLDCIASLETFVQTSSSTNSQEFGAHDRTAGDPDVKNAALPIFNTIRATASDNTDITAKTDQCRESFSLNTGVSQIGEYVDVLDRPVEMFKYTLETPNAVPPSSYEYVNALQLELEDPSKCDWIRLCFDDALPTCSKAENVLDLIFYHRYYVPTDSNRARAFQVLPGELDTIVLDFGGATDDPLVMKYGSVASRSQVKWITHKMRNVKAPTTMFLAAGHCKFRLVKAPSVNLSNAKAVSRRSKLHVKDCVHIM